jgi:hypothetical protein
MSLPAVVFGDPEATVRESLIAGMTGRPEAYATTSVSTYFPATPLAGDDTHLQVELEGTNSEDYPVRERTQVRITAYAAPGRRSNAKDLATLAQGLLLSLPGVFPSTGRSSVIKDPETRNLMCWFLIRADLLAIPLTTPI